MYNQINLSHLKYFYDAVMLNSISAAARENFVSQSAISQGIAKLEQALQVTLTTHQRQSFKLTEEGVIVFDEAKQIFRAVGDLRERLNGLKGVISGEVHFACTNALAQFFLPLSYIKMREKYPLVSLRFNRGSLQFIHEALRQEKVSFALAMDAPQFYNFEKIILSKGCFRLYTAKGVKASSGILIDHEESSEVLGLRKMYAEKYKKELIIQEVLSGWGLVAKFVQMGCGTGFLPEFIFDGNKDVKEVKLDIPPIEYTICAFKAKAMPLSRASQIFLDILRSKL